MFCFVKMIKSICGEGIVPDFPDHTSYTTITELETRSNTWGLYECDLQSEISSCRKVSPELEELLESSKRFSPVLITAKERAENRKKDLKLSIEAFEEIFINEIHNSVEICKSKQFILGKQISIMGL